MLTIKDGVIELKETVISKTNTYLNIDPKDGTNTIYIEIRELETREYVNIIVTKDEWAELVQAVMEHS